MEHSKEATLVLPQPATTKRSIGRPTDAPKVEDMDDALPDRPALKRL